MTSNTSEKFVNLTELIKLEFDVVIQTDDPFFLGEEWWWQGETDAHCLKCKNSFDVYRKPHVTDRGMRIQYWAIACVSCLTLSKLDDLDPEIKKKIKLEYHIPPELDSGAVFDPKSVATQEKVSVRFEITDEQRKAIDAVRSHKRIAIQALAGTGKTTTLTLIAKEFDTKSVQYIAFNKAIVDDVKSKMPASVACNTAHSLAFRSIGYQYSARLNNRGLKQYRDIAKAFDVQRLQLKFDDWIVTYSSSQIAQIAGMAVSNFVKSIDTEMTLEHVIRQIHPRIHKESTKKEIAESAFPLAQRFWADIKSVDGILKFEHDHYLKMWQLSKPIIHKDLILFDEAQDADPVMIDVINNQKDCQLVFCGDSFQQIYEWRGAKDALRAIKVDHVTWLTKSFRFGNEIALEANEVLSRLSRTVKVIGLDEIKSTRNSSIRPNVVLCRTNAGLMSNIIFYLSEGYKVATTIERSYLINFFKECQKLMLRQDVTHHELSAFNSWEELEEWVTSFPTEAGELLSMVRLVNKFSPSSLIDALNRCTEETEANIVVTTAHRAKGREWNNVKIDSDFPHISDMAEEDLRLIYVALTRAKLNIDTSAWDSVEPKPNRGVVNFFNATGLPIPKFDQIPKAKPRRRND